MPLQLFYTWTYAIFCNTLVLILLYVLWYPYTHVHTRKKKKMNAKNGTHQVSPSNLAQGMTGPRCHQHNWGARWSQPPWRCRRQPTPHGRRAGNPHAPHHCRPSVRQMEASAAQSRPRRTHPQQGDRSASGHCLTGRHCRGCGPAASRCGGPRSRSLRSRRPHRSCARKT
jgi:hypothetical protein